MAFPERIAELDRQIAAAVERAVAAVRAELQERLDRVAGDVKRSLSDELPTPVLPPSYLAASDFEPLRHEAADEAARSARDTSLGDLRNAIVEIDRARQQSEILDALIAGARRNASRAGVFLVSPSGVRGWGASGFADDDKVRELSLSWDEDEAWRELRQGLGTVELTAADCARLLQTAEDSLPLGGALVPLVLRDRVAAAIYADRMDAAAPWSLAALQTLTWSAALALETLPFRSRAATPTLRSLAQADEAEALGLWDPEAAVADEAITAMPAAEETPAEAAAPEPMLEAAEPMLEAAEPMLEAAEPMLEAAEPIRKAAEPVWRSTTDWDAQPAPEASSAAGFSFTEASPYVAPPEPLEPMFEAAPEAEAAVEPAWTYEEAAVEAPPLAPEPAPWGAIAPAEPEIAPRPAETVAFQPPSMAPRDEPAFELPPLPELPEVTPPSGPRAVDLGEDETYHLASPAPSRFEAPPAPSSTQEVPAVDEDPTHPGMPPSAVTAPVAQQPKAIWQAGGGSTEVAPPPDLEGPGWAFATTRIPTMPSAAAPEDASHDEARRLARLLVSEIKLYNEEQVEDGRRNRDIYERLKEDIDRSRQMYEERVDERIRNTTDYFYQELVRILAGGDPKAMGI